MEEPSKYAFVFNSLHRVRNVKGLLATGQFISCSELFLCCGYMVTRLAWAVGLFDPVTVVLFGTNPRGVQILRSLIRPLNRTERS